MTDISASVIEVEIDTDAVLIDPDKGMTAASAPATGSQTIIQISRNFRNNFISSRAKLGAEWFRRHY